MRKILGMNGQCVSFNRNRTFMLNEVIKMAWGKVKLDSVITKSLGKMDQERSFVLRPFPHGLLYFVQKKPKYYYKMWLFI